MSVPIDRDSGNVVAHSCHLDDVAGHCIVQALCERYEDVAAALKSNGVYVLEFQVGELHKTGWTDLQKLATQSAGRLLHTNARARSSPHVLFLVHTNMDAAIELAHRSVEVSRGAFAGCCGYVEGGVHFWGADGTFIESDDWETARAYVLALCAEHASTCGCRPRPGLWRQLRALLHLPDDPSAGVAARGSSSDGAESPWWRAQIATLRIPAWRPGWRPSTPEEVEVLRLVREDWEATVAFGSAAVAPLIAARALTDTRKQAGETLARIADAAVKPLIGALVSPAVAAEQVLAMIGAPAVAELISALTAEDWRVRSGAARALGLIGDERAVEPLSMALSDRKHHVRRSAASALRSLGER